uniref:Uncharacterized protein n=1 Tax=Arundo donax TaxID=35708 RepID=A0A0A9FN27_ARUDO
MARGEIIKKLFDTLIYSSIKEERCAGTVWLVSLTMYCGRHPKILELLPQIQVCQPKIRYLRLLELLIHLLIFPLNCAIAYDIIVPVL